MTTPSSRDEEQEEANQNQGNQANQQPRDWRRRRRSERPTPAGDTGQSGTGGARVEPSDEELSQPLIKIFEPALDLVVAFSGPLVLAGI